MRCEGSGFPKGNLINSESKMERKVTWKPPPQEVTACGGCCCTGCAVVPDSPV